MNGRGTIRGRFSFPYAGEIKQTVTRTLWGRSPIYPFATENPHAYALLRKSGYATCVFGAYCFDVSPKNTSYHHRKQYTFQMRIILSLERPSCVLKSALRWSSSIFIR